MDFISATEKGKNAFWRYAAGITIVLIFWLVLGALPVLAAYLWVQIDGNPETAIDLATGAIEGAGPLVAYLVPQTTFPIFLLGIFAAVRGLHNRGLRTLVTPARRIDWERVAVGFGTWLLLAMLMTGLEILLFPGAFRWSGVEPVTYVFFLVLALIFTPIQTSTEELFFRGYLLQATGRLTGSRTVARRLLAAVINGVLFALPHALNPEVELGPVLLMGYYFGMGAFLAWVTLRDGTAELALGAHAANNLFVALLINFERSALQTPALVTTDRFDPVYNLLTFVLSAAVFALVVFVLVPARRERPLQEV